MNWYKTDNDIIYINEELSCKFVFDNYEDHLLSNIKLDDLEIFDQLNFNYIKYEIVIMDDYIPNFNILDFYGHKIININMFLDEYYFLINKRLYLVKRYHDRYHDMDGEIIINEYMMLDNIINLTDIYHMIPEKDIIGMLKNKCNDSYGDRIVKHLIEDVKYGYQYTLGKFMMQMNEKINILEKHLYKLHGLKLDNNINNNNDKDDEIDIMDFYTDSQKYSYKIYDDNDVLIPKIILNKIDNINIHLEFAPDGIGYDDAKKSYDEANNN